MNHSVGARNRSLLSKHYIGIYPTYYKQNFTSPTLSQKLMGFKHELELTSSES